MNLYLPNLSRYEIDDSELLSLELFTGEETLVMTLRCPPKGWRRSRRIYYLLHAIGVLANKSRDEKIVLRFIGIRNLTGSFIDLEKKTLIPTLFTEGLPVLVEASFHIVKPGTGYGNFEFDDGTIEFEFDQCSQEASLFDERCLSKFP